VLEVGFKFKKEADVFMVWEVFQREGRVVEASLGDQHMMMDRLDDDDDGDDDDDDDDDADDDDDDMMMTMMRTMMMRRKMASRGTLDDRLGRLS